MGFGVGNYATVWQVDQGKGNSMSVRLSTSRKKRDTEEYEQDFSGYCMFFGTAKAKAEKLKPKDRIKLGSVDVTTWYNKEKGTERVTYKVFDFEMADGSSLKATTDTKNKTAFDAIVEEGESDEDELPF